MKEIKLLRGEIAIVDDDDYEKLSKYGWYFNKYVKRFVKNGVYVLMHRQILKLRNNPKQVDHIDMNIFNNQKSNLRLATNSQNNANRKSKPGSSSKYLGVGWDKVNKKWRATICDNGVNKNLGRYLVEEDAARAYNSAAVNIHKEFASLNIISQGGS